MIVFSFLLATQTGKPVHPAHVPLPASETNRPVTDREARESFAKVLVLFAKVNGAILGTPSIPSADRPVSRTEIVGEMARVLRAAESTLRFTPAPTRFDVSVLRIDPAQKTALARLIERGYVARIGPLAVGPGNGLTLKEFGDALGFFSARLAQTTHLPSPKWTPMLKND